jgi:hypothetical protein
MTTMIAGALMSLLSVSGHELPEPNGGVLDPKPIVMTTNSGVPDPEPLLITTNTAVNTAVHYQPV